MSRNGRGLRLSLCVAVIVGICLTLVATSPAILQQNQNFAPNPSFESGTSAPDGWISAADVWDGTIAHTGSHSVRLVGPRRLQSERFDLPVGTYYFGFWHRETGNVQYVGAIVGPENGPFVSSAAIGTPDGQWRYYETTYQVSSLRSNFYIDLTGNSDNAGVGSYPGGTVWYDDIWLGTTPQPSPTTPPAPITITPTITPTITSTPTAPPSDRFLCGDVLPVTKCGSNQANFVFAPFNEPFRPYLITSVQIPGGDPNDPNQRRVRLLNPSLRSVERYCTVEFEIDREIFGFDSWESISDRTACEGLPAPPTPVPIPTPDTHGMSINIDRGEGGIYRAGDELIYTWRLPFPDHAQVRVTLSNGVDLLFGLVEEGLAPVEGTGNIPSLILSAWPPGRTTIALERIEPETGSPIESVSTWFFIERLEDIICPTDTHRWVTRGVFLESFNEHEEDQRRAEDAVLLSGAYDFIIGQLGARGVKIAFVKYFEALGFFLRPLGISLVDLVVPTFVENSWAFANTDKGDILAHRDDVKTKLDETLRPIRNNPDNWSSDGQRVCISNGVILDLPPWKYRSWLRKFDFVGIGKLVNYMIDAVSQGESISNQTPSNTIVLIFATSGGAGLYISDPEDRHEGVDPITGQVVHEIQTGRTSSLENQGDFIFIENPVSGKYIVDVINTGSTDVFYTLEVAATNMERRSFGRHETGTIVPGGRDSYQFTVPRRQDTPGYTQPGPTCEESGGSCFDVAGSEAPCPNGGAYIGWCTYDPDKGIFKKCCGPAPVQPISTPIIPEKLPITGEQKGTFPWWILGLVVATVGVILFVKGLSRRRKTSR